MSALSKAVIAEHLCEKVGLNKETAREMVDVFFETLKLALENGNFIKLSGFGNFILRDKQQRPGRNPKTGESIPVVKRRVVTFKPGLKLRQKVEERGKL